MRVLLPLFASLATAFIELSTGQQYPDTASAFTKSSLDVLSAVVHSFPSCPISTLGYHVRLSVSCYDSSLIVVAPLAIPSGMLVQIQDCAVTSNLTSNAMFTVLGNLLVENCTIQQVKTRSFVVFGSLHLENSCFYLNENSIISSLSIGFTVFVTKCRFERNFSQLGTIVLLRFMTSQISSYTNVTFTSCQFAHNSASAAGSFLVLSSVSDLLLSYPQTQEYHGISVSDSQIEESTNYFGFFSADNFSLSFLNCSFMSMDHLFALELHGAELRIEKCDMEVSGRALEVRFLEGTVTLKDVVIEGLVVGPAIIVFNLANIEAGAISIEGLTIVRSVLTENTLLSCTILALNTAVHMTRLKVLDGSSKVGMSGIYSFSAVQLSDVEVRNMTFLGGLLITLGSTLHGSDFRVSQVTMQKGVFLDIIGSQVLVERLIVDDSAKLSEIYGNSIWALDSNLTIASCTFIMTTIGASTAFSLWSTNFHASDVWFQTLSSDLIKAVEYSTAVLTNIHLEEFDSANVVLSSLSTVHLRHLTIVSGQVRASLISAFSQSNITLSHLSLLSGNAQSLVVSSFSAVEISSFVLHSLSADTLFWYIVTR